MGWLDRPRRYSGPSGSLASEPVLRNDNNRKEWYAFDWGNWGSTPWSAVICASVADPPAFQADQYEGWKRPFQYWAELNSGIDEHRSLAAIALHSSGSVEIMILEYFEFTKSRKMSRTVRGWAELMRALFERPDEEHVVDRIQQRAGIRKRQNGPRGEVWLRFDRCVGRLELQGIQWPGNISNATALQEWRLPAEQMTLGEAAGGQFVRSKNPRCNYSC